jgi:hypothetical protein
MKGVRARRYLGYKLGRGSVCVLEKSMVGGGAWRYKVWSEGDWPCFESGCRGRGEVLSRRS